MPLFTEQHESNNTGILSYTKVWRREDTRQIIFTMKWTDNQMISLESELYDGRGTKINLNVNRGSIKWRMPDGSHEVSGTTWTGIPVESLRPNWISFFAELVESYMELFTKGVKTPIIELIDQALTEAQEGEGI